jgi:hypothetical protein
MDKKATAEQARNFSAIVRLKHIDDITVSPNEIFSGVRLHSC